MPNPRAGRPVRTSKSSEDSGRGKWIAAITIALLLVCAVGYAMYPGEDPGVARIEALREQMDSATDEQRRDLFRQMREEYEQLPEAARDRLREEREVRRGLEEQKRMAEFFAMSPQDQIKALDESIQREEKWRKEREKRRAEGGDRGGRGGGGRGGRGGSNGGDPNARRKGYLDRTSPQGRAMQGEYWRMRSERRQKLGFASH